MSRASIPVSPAARRHPRPCDRAEGKGKWAMDQMTRAKTLGFSAERLARIDRFLEEKYVDPGKLPCAQFLLARQGQIVHQTVLGQQDPERGVALREDTVFRIYSMTKPVTSVA